MLTIHPSTKVYICSQAINMRYSFDALSGLVTTLFGLNPLSGHLFVFFSRSRDRMKLLFWDSEGFVLYYKRLERGSFSWLDDLDLSEGGEMDAADFAIILAGINPSVPGTNGLEKSKNKIMPPRTTPLQLV
jgi:transposase